MHSGCEHGLLGLDVTFEIDAQNGGDMTTGAHDSGLLLRVWLGPGQVGQLIESGLVFRDEAIEIPTLRHQALARAGQTSAQRSALVLREGEHGVDGVKSPAGHCREPQNRENGILQDEFGWRQ